MRAIIALFSAFLLTVSALSVHASAPIGHRVQSAPPTIQFVGALSQFGVIGRAVGRSTGCYTNVLVTSGDSLTANAEAPGNGHLLTLNVTCSTPSNTAVGGATIDSASQGAAIDALYNGTKQQNVVTVWFGANDLLGAGDGSWVGLTLKPFCLARRSTGFKIVLATVLPRQTAISVSTRNDANSRIHADPSFYDALADVGGDSLIGCDTCNTNTTYYVGDGTHLNATGYAVAETYFRAAINSLVTH